VIRYRWPAWAPALAQAFELPKQFGRLGVHDRSAEAKARGFDEPAIIGPAPKAGPPPAQSASGSPGLLADSRTNCRTSASNIKVVAVDDNASAQELLKSNVQKITFIYSAL